MADKAPVFNSSLLLQDVQAENQRLRTANAQMHRVESERQTRATQYLQELLSETTDKGMSVEDTERLVQLLLGDDEDGNDNDNDNDNDGGMAADAFEIGAENADDPESFGIGGMARHRLDWDIEALRELADKGTVRGAGEMIESAVAEGSRFEVDGESRFVVFTESLGVRQARTLDEVGEDGVSCLDVIVAAWQRQSECQVVDDAWRRVGELQASAATAGFFWLDVIDPTKAEMDVLARAFGVHPLTVEDILEEDVADSDKIEEVMDYHFVVYRAADPEGASEMAASGLAMVVKKSFILTFHARATVGHVEQSIDRVRMLTGVCPMYVAYAVMDSVTDALMADMRAVELEVDKVDEVVLVLSQSEKADVLQRTGLVRRRILGLWRLATGKPEVVKAVLRATVRLPPTAFTADAEHLLGDVLDHLWALVSACAHCEMVLSRAHSNYMGQISLELGDASVGTTMFSSQWLVITAILLPVQFVTGLFGMNVPVPFQGDQPGHDNLNAWMTIMACCVGFVVVFGGWAKWKKIF